LAPLVAGRPGIRVPGAADGFELAVRAVLGQQVSVAAARTFCARLVAALGEPPAGDRRPFPTHPPPSAAACEKDAPPAGDRRLFPTPAAVAGADLAGLGLTRARAATLAALAEAVASGALELDAGADRAATGAALRALPGIGPWTASYILMRGLGD